MKRGLALSILAAAGALTLAGCGTTAGSYPASAPANYAPYDYDTNPNCGVFGTCEPLNTRPIPLRGSSG